EEEEEEEEEGGVPSFQAQRREETLTQTGWLVLQRWVQINIHEFPEVFQRKMGVFMCVTFRVSVAAVSCSVGSVDPV
ncbi:hypothetical protein NQZ68_012727, partial [Dissostichus eleginoides]